uniref:Cytochrome P450 n=1 Tax=Plectus sambesii TaxID=2011161 RepID=A0A914XH44_9BILA
MIVLLAISVLFAAYLYYEFVGKRKKYPPGPSPLPLLGNLLQMDQTYPEKAFVEWGKKYGPIFTVWIPTPIVIINEYELMKETVIKQGDIFAGRPEMFIIDALLKGNYGLLFTRGQMWRENKRFALHVLRDFGVGRNQLHSQIMEQATELISNLHQQKAPINVRDYILFAVANVINIVTFGKAWKFGDPEIFKLKDRLERLSKESMGLGMLLLESFPFLRHLEPPLNIGLKRVMAVNNEIIDFLFEQINQHKEALDESQPPKDFTDAYLMEIRKRANGPDAGNELW